MPPAGERTDKPRDEDDRPKTGGRCIGRNVTHTLEETRHPKPKPTERERVGRIAEHDEEVGRASEETQVNSN